MESNKFINNYDYFLNEISLVVKPELLPILDEIKELNTNDLIHTDSMIQNESDSRVFVWRIFIRKALYNSDYKKP